MNRPSVLSFALKNNLSGSGVVSVDVLLEQLARVALVVARDQPATLDQVPNYLLVACLLSLSGYPTRPISARRA